MGKVIELAQKLANSKASTQAKIALLMVFSFPLWALAGWFIGLLSDPFYGQAITLFPLLIIGVLVYGEIEKRGMSFLGDFGSGFKVELTRPQDKKVYAQVQSQWKSTMEHVRAYLDVEKKSLLNGELKKVKKFPEIVRATSDPLGLAVTFRVLPGWTADDFDRKKEAIGNLIGLPIRSITQRQMGFATMIIDTVGDVLAGTRSVVAQDLGLRARIARAETGGDVYLDFADATHTIVQGSTRSGKSVLMYAVLAQIARSPHAEIWGCDPNRVLLAPLANTLEDEERNRRFVVGNNPQQALEMLERVTALMDARIESLVPRRLEKIAEFTPEEPVIIVVLEEYAGLMAQALIEDKKVHAEIKKLVGRLFAEGAKAGVRMVMILQRAEASIIDGATRANAMQRITLGVDNGDSVRMLHEGLDSETAEAITHFKNGRFIINQHRENRVGQADFLEYTDYLDSMDELAGRTH